MPFELSVKLGDYSKYLQIYQLSEIIARYGSSVAIVTDNGTQFISKEFNQFIKINRIIHNQMAKRREFLEYSKRLY